MNDDLVQWLRAQLDEDERVARPATPGPWAIWRDLDHQGFYTVGDEAGVVPEGAVESVGEANPTAHVYVEEDADHIALHDPARVLREVEAKRRILDLHRPVADSSWPEPGHCLECCSLESQDYRKYPCPTVRLLALPYSDRPGYQERWRP